MEVYPEPSNRITNRGGARGVCDSKDQMPEMIEGPAGRRRA